MRTKLPALAITASQGVKRMELAGSRVLGALIFLCGAIAAPQASAEQLTVGNLLSAVLEGHPLIQARQADIAAAKDETTAAKMQFLPSPQVSTERVHGKQATIVGLVQPLWSGGRLTTDLRISELKEQRDELALDETRTELALRLVTLYQSLLDQTWHREAEVESLERLRSFVEMTRRRVDQGVAPQADLDLAESRLAQSRSECEQATSALRTIRAQIGNLVGNSLPQEDVAIDKSVPTQISLDEAQSGARAYSATLRRLDMEARVAAMEVDGARASAMPTLSLRVEKQKGEYVGSLPPGNRAYLQFQYTPGAGLASLSRIESSRSRAHSAELAVDAARRELKDKVQGEWDELNSALLRLPDLRRSRSATGQATESSIRLFFVGRRSWLDLLNSVRELKEVQKLEADALAMAIGSNYRLRVLVGEQL